MTRGAGLSIKTGSLGRWSAVVVGPTSGGGPGDLAGELVEEPPAEPNQLRWRGESEQVLSSPAVLVRFVEQRTQVLRGRGDRGGDLVSQIERFLAAGGGVEQRFLLGTGEPGVVPGQIFNQPHEPHRYRHDSFVFVPDLLGYQRELAEQLVSVLLGPRPKGHGQAPYMNLDQRPERAAVGHAATR